MIQFKRLCRIGLFLAVICMLGMFIPAATAEGGQQLVYYVLIDNTVDASFLPQDMLPELLKGFSYLHPDSVNVSFKLYRIINTENPTAVNTQFELLCSSELSDADISTVSYSLNTIGQLPGNNGRFTFESLEAEMAREQESRLLYIGSFTPGKIASLQNSFVTRFQGVPYQIIDTQMNTVSFFVNYLYLDLNDTIDAVYKLYQSFVLPNYSNQELTEYRTNENTKEFQAGEYNTEIKAIAPVNSYDHRNQPYYSGKRLNLITFEPGADRYALDLESNGQDKTIVISAVYQPFTLAELEGPAEEYTMKDTLRISGRIIPRNDSITDEYRAEDWTLEIKLQDDAGNEKEVLSVMPDADGRFRIEKQLNESAGMHMAFLEAVNHADDTKSIRQALGQFNVLNNAPFPRDNPEQATHQAEIWRNGPVNPDNETMIDLAALFDDDGPMEDLVFQLNEDHPQWIAIDNSRLVIDEQQIDQNATVSVYATDKGGLSSPAISLTIIYHDAGQMLQGALAEITLEGQNEKGEFERDSVITVKALLNLPETAKPYLEKLEEQGKGGALLELLKATFGLDDDEKTVPFEQRSPENPFQFVAGTEYEQIWRKDRYPVSFKALLNGEVYAEANTEIEITDHVPVVRPGIAESQYHREVTGPEIGPLKMNQDLPREEREVYISIPELVETEAGDIITIHISGDAEMKLYRNGQEYSYTDEVLQEPEYEPVAGEDIAWDTTKEDDKPAIRFWKTARGDWSVTMDIQDQDGIQAVNSPVGFHVSSRFHDEQKLIIISAGILAAIAAAILYAIIHQARKPKFREEDELQVSCADYTCRIPLKTWGKKELSLVDVLHFSGAPIVGTLPFKHLEQIKLKAGRKDKRVIVSGLKKGGIPVQLNQTNQGGNIIRLTYGDEAGFELNDQTEIKLTVISHDE